MIDLTQYNTIIFDFGGVILDINPELSINAFKKYGGEAGMKKIEESDILWQFERGEIDVKTIHEGICKYIGATLSEDEFINYWCALLLEYKPKRIEKIKELAKTHKLIMLSNTNEIHFAYFSQKLKDEYGITFNDLFSEVYLSHEMGLVKPDKAIYEQVIKEQNLIPEQTLFIEDTLANAKAAEDIGIKTLVIPRNGSFYDYF